MDLWPSYLVRWLFLWSAMRDIIELKGVGEKTKKSLLKLGILYIEDLFTYFPRQYDKMLPPVCVNEIKVGEINTLAVRLKTTPVTIRVRNLSISTCVFYDETGSVEAVYFNMPFVAKTMKTGNEYIIKGFIRQKGNKLQIEHPKLFSREEYARLQNTLQPIYPLTEGISNNFIIKCIKQAFSMKEIWPMQSKADILPEELIKKYGLMTKEDCVYNLHFPKTEEMLIEARNSLVFREFFVFTLRLRMLKRQNQQENVGAVMEETIYEKRLIESLPYRLTKAQERTFLDIKYN